MSLLGQTPLNKRAHPRVVFHKQHAHRHQEAILSADEGPAFSDILQLRLK
jgi:hypothetical protein